MLAGARSAAARERRIAQLLDLKQQPEIVTRKRPLGSRLTWRYSIDTLDRSCQLIISTKSLITTTKSK
jgi:hypothetical protein